MTSESVESLVDAFREFLRTEPPPAPTEPPPRIDLQTVVAQFTALRQEVNLLTKTARVTLDQNAELIRSNSTTPDEKEAAIQPFLKAILDVADALLVARKQIEKSQLRLEPLFESLAVSDLPEIPTATKMSRPGFFARLLGVPTDDTSEVWRQWAERIAERDRQRTTQLSEAYKSWAPLVSGLADGYAMSLRRIEKLFPQFGITPIATVGEPFDPERMEALEMVQDDTVPSGHVVDEIRRGYLRHDKILRFAQVRTAR